MRLKDKVEGLCKAIKTLTNNIEDMTREKRDDREYMWVESDERYYECGEYYNKMELVPIADVVVGILDHLDLEATWSSPKKREGEVVLKKKEKE